MIIKIVGKIFILAEKCKWKYVYKSYRTKYNISDTFLFNGFGIQLYGEGDIILGSNSYIGEGSNIQAYEGTTVRIGDNCSISHQVRIYTFNNDANDVMNEVYPRAKHKANVSIGNNCWIGATVFIKEGVSIGDNCVIGANSVVTKDIPSNSIAGGVPAKIIRQKR
jgi:maltose O-acetyltransferase